MAISTYLPFGWNGGGFNAARMSSLPKQIGVSLAVIAVLTAGAWILHFGLPSAGFIYLLAILVIAIKWGFGLATFTSLVSSVCLNYFFVAPLFSFDVAERQDWVALGVFELTALLASSLSARDERHVQEKLLQRQSIEKLYQMSKSTLQMDLRQPPGPQIVELIHEIFNMEAIALFDASLKSTDKAGNCCGIEEQLAYDAYLRNIVRTDSKTHTSQHVLLLDDKPIGGLMLRGQRAPIVADALGSLTALALERYRLFEKESYADAAQQSEALRVAVLDALAHAFKTPLTVILTASSGLLELGGLNWRQQELAVMIDEQSTQLNELANRLLQTARLEEKQVAVKKEDVIISSMIEDVLRQQPGKTLGRRFEVNIPDNSITTKGDPGLIATIVSQFVDNAAKYSRPGSAILIEAKQRLAEVLISVHNEGPAIRMEDRDLIFERFYRCQDAKDSVPGTGLGLSIAKKAAAAHNGHVWVISAEDVGTTFYLSLPKQ